MGIKDFFSGLFGKKKALSEAEIGEIDVKVEAAQKEYKSPADYITEAAQKRVENPAVKSVRPAREARKPTRAAKKLAKAKKRSKARKSKK